MTSNSWRRSRLVWPDAALTIEDDWTLVSPSGETLARIYDAGRDDGVEDGAWRWRIYPRDGVSIGGSAIDGRAAKKIVENRIADTRAKTCRN